MPIVSGNISTDMPPELADEQFTELLSAPNVRVDRIVTTGQTTAADQFLDQDRAEWVLILQGSAQILFEGEAAPRPLGRGDYMHIPPHARHRVEWTLPDEPTVWLAIHYQPTDSRMG
jgi:cupin 2 domain-containing protein